MNPRDKLGLAGHLTIVLRDGSGKLKDMREVRNLVVNTGVGYIAGRMIDPPPAAMSHMALGSGTVAVAAGDTDLGSLLGARKALDSSTLTGTISESVVYSATFDPGEGTGAVTEAGIFNALSAGTMLCRTVFPVVNKQAADTLQITWTITLAAT